MSDAKAEPEGYKNFGSFHTASVEHMLAAPAADWSRPPMPFDEAAIVDAACARVRAAEAGAAPAESDDGGAVAELGRGTADALPLGRALVDGGAFFVEKDWCFVNHGAFGGALAPAVEAAQAWQKHVERQPLRFIDRELFPHVVHSLREIAVCMASSQQLERAAGSASGAASDDAPTTPPPCDVVFLPNATTGLNVAIAAAPLGPSRPAFTLSICYGALKKMLTHACAIKGAEAIVHDTPFPPPTDAADSPEAFDDWVVSLYEEHLPEGAGLAVVDAVTSNTALALPVRRVAEVCARKGVPLLVDGAHALGTVGGCGPDSGATWYVTNCHKWWSSPRGLGAMWVAPAAQADTRPLVVSHGYGSGFASEFVWDGCRDYSAQLAVPAAAAFRRAMGGEARVAAYCRALLRLAVSRLTARWGTSTPVPAGCFSHMALVGVPDASVHPSGRGGAATSAHAKALQDRLHESFRVECPVKCHGGRLFVRISAAAYNCPADYDRLAEAVEACAAEE